MLQRKCDCGQHTIGGGGCSECEKKKGTLQPKASSSEPANDVPPIVHQVLGSPGQPLDAGTRAFMEAVPPPPAQPSPPTQQVAENPPQITIPANPVAAYGAITADRRDAVVFGGSGRAVHYADGTVEFYPAGSGGRRTYRPQPAVKIPMISMTKMASGPFSSE